MSSPPRADGGRPRADAGRQQLFGFGVLKAKYELLPLVACLSFACVIGAAYSVYAIYQKPDVRLNKKTTDIPPWEEVDPEKRQKLLTLRQKYEKINELEKLRSDIGSYKY
jgi:hypothetical protein